MTRWDFEFNVCVDEPRSSIIAVISFTLHTDHHSPVAAEEEARAFAARLVHPEAILIFRRWEAKGSLLA